MKSMGIGFEVIQLSIQNSGLEGSRIGLQSECSSSAALAASRHYLQSLASKHVWGSSWKAHHPQRSRGLFQLPFGLDVHLQPAALSAPIDPTSKAMARNQDISGSPNDQVTPTRRKKTDCLVAFTATPYP